MRSILNAQPGPRDLKQFASSIIVGMNPAHHGLGMASGALGQARGAPALRDVKQSQRPLAGAGVGCAQSQVTQVLRRLTPAREINT